jgi:hypothetical protein
MTEYNPISTTMEQNLKLTSKEENEFEDATCYRAICTCPKGKGLTKANWRNKRLSYHCHLNKIPLSI